MNLKIEEGKYYKTHSGRKVGPAIKSGSSKETEWSVPWDGFDYYYDEQGFSWIEKPEDKIISEWKEEPKVKLEVGKKYELNNGEVHECILGWLDHKDRLSINDVWYHEDGITGCFEDLPDYDLHVKRCVEEAPEPSKTWGEMTPEEKGALLLAHHEGKIIESLLYDWAKCSPSWTDSVAYRIKPEPKRETIELYGDGRNSWAFDYSTSNATHYITFDVIDGEPDVNSIKMEKI